MYLKIRGGLINNIKFIIELLYRDVGKHIEKGNLKVALEEIFDFTISINKYFDEKTPWITVNTDKDECRNTIYNCLVAIINIANLLQPFLLFPSSKVKAWLNCDIETWKYINLSVGTTINNFDILIERLDKNIIVKELGK